MKQWDTADWVLPAGKAGPGAANHPCVILSPDAICANPHFKEVNILAGQSHRAQRLPEAHEVILDAADGMNWDTIIKLIPIWHVPKSELRPRQTVTNERRRELGRKLIRLFGLSL